MRLRHFGSRICQGHDAVYGGGESLRVNKMRTIRVIEVCDTLPSKLQMLLLVVTNRYMSGPVNENVGRLEDRVGEEAKLETCAG
jgi:hypothetical protein